MQSSYEESAQMRPKTLNHFALLLTTLALTGAAQIGASLANDPAAGDPGWVQQEEVMHQLIDGMTHYRTRIDGGVEVEYQSPDGRSAYLLEGCLYRGEWWIEENIVCFRYPELSGSQQSCFWLRQAADGIEFWDTTVPEATQPTAVTDRTAAGNAENLALDGRGDCLDL